jgi:hypothetical protein
MDVSGQFDNVATLIPGKEPSVPSGEEAGWIAEPVRMMYPSRESNRGLPACNRSLYRLRHPGEVSEENVCPLNGTDP